MNTPLKQGRKPQKPLKEDIFNHLDSIYRSARRVKNYAIALKAVEVCIKAKKVSSKPPSPMFNIQEMSDEDLEKILQTLQSQE
ncbi:MAG: hypothetical protein Q8Q56_04090 [Alphaproteobacteria bacterium]|nr:hypothetical protein [Alphaproteobacteria bacterium]